MEEDKRTREILSEMLKSGIANEKWTTVTHLFVTIKDNTPGGTIFQKYYTSKGQHTERNMLEDQEFQRTIEIGGVLIIMTTNYSPCSECVRKLIMFYNENKKFIQKFTIEFSHIYREDDKNNRDGLLDLRTAGIILEAMTESSWFDVLVSVMFRLPPESVKDRDEDTKKKLENILRVRSHWGWREGKAVGVWKLKPNYYISEIVCALWLVNLAGRILQYGPQNLKLCFLRALYFKINRE